MKLFRFLALLAALMLCVMPLGGMAEAYVPQEDPWSTPEGQDLARRMGEAAEETLAALGKEHRQLTYEEQYALYGPFEAEIRELTGPGMFPGLPEEGEVTYDEALEIAIRGVMAQYGRDSFVSSLRREDLVSFYRVDDGDPIWQIDFFMYEGSSSNLVRIYQVTINARTGEIENLHAGENGYG